MCGLDGNWAVCPAASGITDAIDRGILKRADENARLLIGGFLENVRGESVTFVTAGGLEL